MDLFEAPSMQPSVFRSQLEVSELAVLLGRHPFSIDLAYKMPVLGE
jgi:hypothetical protein